METQQQSNEGCSPKKESPIDKAKETLRNSLSTTREVASKFETILASVLTEPEKESVSQDGGSQPSQSSLEAYLWTMNDLVISLRRHLDGIQQRVQL